MKKTRALETNKTLKATATEENLNIVLALEQSTKVKVFRLCQALALKKKLQQ